MKPLRTWTFLVPLTALSLCFPQPSGAREVARLQLQSEPGDFIGGGGTYDLTYETPGPFDIDDQTGSYRPDEDPYCVTFTLREIPHSWLTYAYLAFGSDYPSRTLQPGTYEGAHRMWFNYSGEPGLDVTFQNRGSSQVFGSFTVHEATFFKRQGTRRVASFAATFEQHSETPTRPALYGSFTYRNYDAPQVIPEPGTLVLLGSGALGILARRKRQ